MTARIDTTLSDAQMPAKRNAAEPTIDPRGRSPKDVGRRLWRIRRVAGITQVEMSRELELEQNTYSTYEVGARMCPVHVASAICDKFNVSLDYIYHGSPDAVQHGKLKQLDAVQLPAKLRS